MIEGLGRKSLMPAGKRARGAYRQPRARRHPRRVRGPTSAAARRSRTRRSRTSRRPCCYLLGLPVDADMDGRVLVDALRPGARPAQPIAVNDEPYALPEGGPSATRPTTSSGSRTCWRGSATYEAARRHLLPPRRGGAGAPRRGAGRVIGRTRSRRTSCARSSSRRSGSGRAVDRRRARCRPSSAARSTRSPSTTARRATTRSTFPILTELGLRATFFVVPTLVDTPGYVTWAQLREMVAAGMEIGSHSLTHPFVNALDRAGLEREFGESKRILESRLGVPVRSASLPRGWEPPRPACRCCRSSATARSAPAASRWWHPGARPLAMPRVAIRRGICVGGVRRDRERRSRARSGACRRSRRAKNAAKACLGVDGWQRLRAPLLALRERV